MAKIIETRNLSDYEVWSDTGWEELNAVHKTIEYQVWEICTKNFSLKCADEHIVFGKDHKEIFVKDLQVGDEILTEKGLQKITSIQVHDDFENMYDVSLVNGNHRFYSNGILSHNTTLMTIYALWVSCFEEDQRVMIVANREQTAINIYKRVRTAFEQLPNFLKPGVKEYGQTGVTFDNDSSIGVSTTTATAVRGESISLLIIDEMAFIENHLIEDFWSSVIPVVSSSKKSKIFAVSTPNGTDNKFYEIYSEAEKGKIAWKAERVDWWDIPGRTEKWKQQQIQLLGSEEKFQQEYGNVFLDPGNSAVGATVIERFKVEKKDPLFRFDDDSYRVFEKPNIERQYVIGVDVGEGIGRASSVAQVLDITDLKSIEQVAIYSSNTTEPYHFANNLVKLCNQWGNPPLLVERNNCGGQVIDALYYKHQYEKIVSCSKISPTASQTTRNLGILSHTNLRFSGVSNMRYWTNTLQAVKINDIDTIKELETFIKYPNGTYRKKNDKFFDDRVLSLVWALFILETEICQQYFSIESMDGQNKPAIISDIGYWDKEERFYGVKELSNSEMVLPSSLSVSSNPSPSLFRDLDSLLDNDKDVWDFMAEGWMPIN
jgi:hypothetical protein